MRPVSEMSGKFQTSKVVTVSVSHLFHDIYTAFLAPMLPLLIARFGLSLSVAGMMDVVRKIPSLFNPFVGLLADRISVKYFVILTPALTALSMSFLGLSSSVAILFILLFVTGISSTLFHVPAPVMIKQFSGRKIATGMSFFMFGGELARTIGPLMITAALSWWGLEGSYKVAPVGILASVVLFFKLGDVSSLDKTRNGNKKQSAAKTIRGLASFFVFIIGFQFFRAAMKSTLTLYLPVYLINAGESLWLAGIALSVLQFAGAAGTFGAGYIADRIGHRNTLLISALACPFVMWLLIGANEVIMILLLIVMGFLLFASGPIILAKVQETNTARPAFVNSIYMTLNFSISSIMVLLVGVAGDHLGLELTFKISAGLAFLSVPFILILPKKENK